MFEILKRSAYAEFDLCADGPVLISSGQSNKTDPTLPDNTFMTGFYGKDHVKNFVIPGSTVKGVIRHYMTDCFSDEFNEFFGTLRPQAYKSKIKFNDAYAVPDTVVTAVRYSTKLNPLIQSAETGTLNNMQVVESGVFKASFSVKNYTDTEMEKLLCAIYDINSGAVTFGGKKSRGFGHMKVQNFRLYSFDGYNSDLSKKNEKMFDSIEKAVKYFRGADK